MKFITQRIILALLLFILPSCSAQSIAAPLEPVLPISTQTTQPIPPATSLPQAVQATPVRAAPSSPSDLFIETTAPSALSTPNHVARARYVTINLPLLLDETGAARKLPEHTEITINLFQDVVYTGVIEQVNQDENGDSWAGYLKGVEFSGLTMVYTSGVFIGHFASPAGVFEVSTVGDDIYQVIQIDQQKLQGGEG